MHLASKNTMAATSLSPKSARPFFPFAKNTRGNGKKWIYSGQSDRLLVQESKCICNRWSSNKRLSFMTARFQPASLRSPALDFPAYVKKPLAGRSSFVDTPKVCPKLKATEAATIFPASQIQVQVFYGEDFHCLTQNLLGRSLDQFCALWSHL